MWFSNLIMLEGVPSIVNIMFYNETMGMILQDAATLNGRGSAQ